MWSKEQISRWKQGKFRMAERKEYLAWREAGKPAFQEPKAEEPKEEPKASAPVEGPLNQGEASLPQSAFLNYSPPAEEPAQPEPAAPELAPAGPSVDDIMTFTPTATTGTQTGTIQEEPEEEGFISGLWNSFKESDFGQFLQGTEVGDFFLNDLGVYIDQGLNQRAVAGETAELLFDNYDSTDVQEYIDSVNQMNAQQQTEEQIAFNKEIEENGGGFWGVVKATFHNPSAATGIMITSLIAMTTPEAGAAGAAIVGTGAAAGTVGGPIGTALGTLASAPAAMGAVSAMTDATLTFNEYMQEELRKGGLEFNAENIQNLLNDPDTIVGLRAAAAARGIAIGVIDALTFKLGQTLGGVTKAAGVGKGTRALAGTVTESVGGAVGEAAGQTTELISGTRESYDTTEIALEGIAEVGSGGVVLQATQAVAEATGVRKTDSKPITESVPRPSVRTVSSLATSGVIANDTTIDVAVPEIQRIAVKTVATNLKAAGIEIENATPEQIEAEIKRIDVEVLVSNLKTAGIISTDAKPEEAILILKR